MVETDAEAIPPEPTRRADRRGARSRRAIVETAARMFAERGYSGASLNEIILASGLTKGGFYFHFASKLDLARAVIDHQVERGFAQVRAEVGAKASALDRLKAVPRVFARLSERGEGPAATRRLIEDLAREPEVRDEVCLSYRSWIQSAAKDLRAAQAEGSVRPDLDPDMLAEVAIAAFLGAQTLSEQFDDGGFERRIEAQIHVIELAASAKTTEGGTR